MSFFPQNQFPYSSSDQLNLDWLLRTVKQLQADLDTLKAEVSGYQAAANAYTDKAIAAALDNFQAQLDITVDLLNKNYAEFKSQINANVEQLLRDFDKLRADMSDAIIGANAYTDTKIAQNNDFIFEQIGSQIISAKVTNPFTGEMITLQDMVNYLSNLHMTGSISYAELTAKSRTYTQLAAYGMTYTQLATNGKTIIV